MTPEEVRDAVFGYNCVVKKSLGNRYILIRITEKELANGVKKEMVEYVLCGNDYLLMSPIDEFGEFEPTTEYVKNLYLNGEVFTSTKFR